MTLLTLTSPHLRVMPGHIYLFSTMYVFVSITFLILARVVVTYTRKCYGIERNYPHTPGSVLGAVTCTSPLRNGGLLRQLIS